MSSAGTSEIMVWDETQVKQVEALPIKRELLERHSSGIQVIVYWLKQNNVVTLSLIDEDSNSGCEFVIPNDEVMEWFAHPFAHPDANMPIKEQP